MRTTLEIILALFGALAVASGLVLLAIVVGCSLFAGSCWYGVQRFRGGRRAAEAEREAGKR